MYYDAKKKKEHITVLISNNMDSQIYSFLAIINTALGGKVTNLHEPDWEKLLAYAKKHKLTPLLYEGCSKYKIFNSAPEEIRNKYLLETLDKIRGQIIRNELFLNIYDKLILAGLKPLVLKGLLCHSLYEELRDHRLSKDEDIYIKKEEFEQYKSILLQNGFVMEDTLITNEVLSSISEVSFYHSKGFVIEVHVNLMRKSNSINKRMNACFEDAFDTCICNDIDGHQIYSMNPTKSFLYLFFHFYKHFMAYGAGLRQIIDILLYGKKNYEKVDWTTVERFIQALSADKLYADILCIGRKYFNIHIKTSFMGYNERLLLKDIMEAGIFGKATAERRLGGNLTLAAVNKGAPDYIGMLFPKKEALSQRYKKLYTKPGQLPVIWAKRLTQFIRYNFNILILYKSIKVGRCRIKLLRNYGIIN